MSTVLSTLAPVPSIVARPKMATKIPASITTPNVVETFPGKGYFVALRLYGPLEPWFDKTWRPGEIELVG